MRYRIAVGPRAGQKLFTLQTLSANAIPEAEQHGDHPIRRLELPIRPDPKTALVYSGQWGCLEQFQSGLIHFVNRIRDRRFVAVDQERGIVFAFGFFDHSVGESHRFKTPSGRDVVAGPVQPWTWQIAEIFKIEKGLITKIDAFLQRCPYGRNSGWSTWEQGMSDQVRDVTFEAPTGI